jgi:hypothetical protein
MLKFLRVKTDTKSILYQDVKEEYAMYGGRGLIAKILNDEVNPKCDVLGPENKFIAWRPFKWNDAFLQRQVVGGREKSVNRRDQRS